MRLSTILRSSLSHGKKAWFKSHVNDEFVKKAKQENYRSRAVFKLEEIDKKYKIIGKNVIDLGSAPGGWSEYIQKQAQSKDSQSTRIVAVDLLPMKPIEGVEFYQCDARDERFLEMLYSKHRHFDTVVSDMAPNFSGVAFETHEQILELNLLCLIICLKLSSDSSRFLVKTIEGEYSKPFFQLLEQLFEKAVRYKPKASKPESKQFYFVAKAIKGQLLNLKQGEAKASEKLIEFLEGQYWSLLLSGDKTVRHKKQLIKVLQDLK